MDDTNNEINNENNGNLISNNSRRGMNSTEPDPDVQLPSSISTSTSATSMTPTLMYREHHRSELHSLYMAAQLARSQWLNQNSLNLSQSLNLNSSNGQLVDRNGDVVIDSQQQHVQFSTLQSDLQVWDQLLSDIQAGAQSQSIQITTSSNANIFSSSPFATSSNTNSAYNPTGRLLPHPIWARRYQGPAGDWLRVELGRRNLTSTPTSTSAWTRVESPEHRGPGVNVGLNFRSWVALQNRNSINGGNGNGSGDSSRVGGSLLFPSLDPQNRSNSNGIEIRSNPTVASSNNNGFSFPTFPRNREPTRYDTALRPQFQSNGNSISGSDMRSRAREVVADLARSRRERAIIRAEERRAATPSTSTTSNPNPPSGGRSRATQAADSFLNRLRRLDGLIPDEENHQDPNGDGPSNHSSSSSSSSFSSEANTEESLPNLRPQDLFPWYGPSSSTPSTSNYNSIAITSTIQQPSTTRDSPPTSPSYLFSRLSLSDSREDSNRASSSYNPPLSDPRGLFDPDGDLMDAPSLREINDRSSWYSNARARMDRAQQNRPQRTNSTNRRNGNETSGFLYDPPTLSPSNFDNVLQAPSLPPASTSAVDPDNTDDSPRSERLVFISDSEEEDRVSPAERAYRAEREIRLERRRERERRRRERERERGVDDSEVGVDRNGDEEYRSNDQERPSWRRERDRAEQDGLFWFESNRDSNGNRNARNAFENQGFDPDGEREMDQEPSSSSNHQESSSYNNQENSSTTTRTTQETSNTMSTLTSQFRPTPSGGLRSRMQRIRNRAALVMSDEGVGEDNEEAGEGETSLGRRVNGRNENGNDARGVERGWIVVEPSITNQEQATPFVSSPTVELPSSAEAFAEMFPRASASSENRSENTILTSRRMSASPDQMGPGENDSSPTSAQDSSSSSPAISRRSIDLRATRAPRRLASLTESDLPSSRPADQSRTNSNSTSTTNTEILETRINSRSGAPSPDSSTSDPDRTLTGNSSFRAPRSIPSYSSPVRRAEWMGSSSRENDASTIASEPHPTRRDVGEASWEEHRERIANQALATMRNNETWTGSEAERAFLREIEGGENEEGETESRAEPPQVEQQVSVSEPSSQVSDLVGSSSAQPLTGLEASIRALALTQTAPTSHSSRTPSSNQSSATRAFLARAPSKLARRASFSSVTSSSESSSTSSPLKSQDDTSLIKLPHLSEEESATLAFSKAVDAFAKASILSTESELIWQRLKLLNVRERIDQGLKITSTLDDTIYPLCFELWSSSDVVLNRNKPFEVQVDDDNITSMQKSKNVDLIFNFRQALHPENTILSGASFIDRFSSSISRESDQSSPLLDRNGAPNAERSTGSRSTRPNAFSATERVSQVRAEDVNWRMARREIIMNPFGANNSSSRTSSELRAERHAERRRALGMPSRSTTSNFSNEEGEELLRSVVPTLAAQGGERFQSRFSNTTFTIPQLEVLRRISAARASSSREARFSALSSLNEDEVRILRDLVASRISLLSSNDVTRVNTTDREASTSNPEFNQTAAQVNSSARGAAQNFDESSKRFKEVLKPAEELPLTAYQKTLISRLFYCFSQQDGSQTSRSQALSQNLLQKIISSRTESFRSTVRQRLKEMVPQDSESTAPIFTMSNMKIKTSKRSGAKAVQTGLVFSSYEPIEINDLEVFDGFEENDLRCLVRERKAQIAGLEEEKLVVMDEDQEMKDFGDPFAMQRRRREMEESWKSDKLERVPKDSILPIGYFSIDSKTNEANLEFFKTKEMGQSSRGISGSYLAIKLLRSSKAEGDLSDEGMELQFVGMQGWSGLRSRGAKGEWRG